MFAADFTTEPYWREDRATPSLAPAARMGAADVAIVGSGVTGLSAALTLARAGRQVLVLEAGDAGQGASTRNTGVIGRSLKHSFSGILRQEGKERACRIYGEARQAFDFVIDLVGREDIECRLQQHGRFMGALSPRQYETIARELELKHRHLGDAFEMISRQGQDREIGSELFHGGGVIPDHYLLHPGRLHDGLLARVISAGTQIQARTSVTGVRREIDGFRLRTTGGELRARKVLIATNGYTGPATPYLYRRIVPLDAFMLATEPLTGEVMKRLLPRGRCFHDYNVNVDYGRPSPDGSRLLFGGLTTSSPRDLRKIAVKLQTRLTRIFPQLRAVRLSHLWTGRCAAPFDLYPHVGERDGLHYALGYCFGSGVPLGLWLGHKAALRILGSSEGNSVFADRELPARLYYWGRPWFIPIVRTYYGWRDRRTS
jgi:glycine/D-amino acid oxidase-like deaminating enzyme